MRVVPVTAICLIGLLAASGCSGGARETDSSPTATASGVEVIVTTTTTTATATTTTTTTVASTPGESGEEYRLVYNWGVPMGTGAPVTIEHTLEPGELAATLTGIYVGDHSQQATPYQRISFYFRGGFPDYRFEYAPQVHHASTDEIVPVPAGSNFLVIDFRPIRTRYDDGTSSIEHAPSQLIGYSHLRSYVPAGAYGFSVRYALGIKSISGYSVPPYIRAGELKKPASGTGFDYVVHFDVRLT